jgi:serine/threonine protein phosphatase PrpC
VAASGGDVALPRTPGAPLRVVRHDELGREHRLMPTRTIGARTGSAVCTVELRVWRAAMTEMQIICGRTTHAGDLEYGQPNPVITAVPDVALVPLRAASDDALVLCTDGITSVLSDEVRCDDVCACMPAKRR